MLCYVGCLNSRYVLPLCFCIHDVCKWQLRQTCGVMSVCVCGPKSCGSRPALEPDWVMLLQMKMTLSDPFIIPSAINMLSKACMQAHTHARRHTNTHKYVHVRADTTVIPWTVHTCCMYTLQQVHTQLVLRCGVDRHVLRLTWSLLCMTGRVRLSVWLTTVQSQQLLHLVWFISQSGFNVDDCKRVSYIPHCTLLVDRFTDITESFLLACPQYCIFGLLRYLNLSVFWSR